MTHLKASILLFLLSICYGNTIAQCTVSVAASPSNICTGQSTNLNANGSGISSYSWSTGSTLQSIAVSPTISTTYTVWATDQFSCTSSNTLYIRVDQGLPVITATLINNNTVSQYFTCPGQTMTLTASGADTYSFYNLSFGATGLQFIPISSGYFTVMGSNACGNNTVVNIPPAPVFSWTLSTIPMILAVDNTVTCLGGSVTLNSPNSYSVTWNPPVLNNTPFIPAASAIYTATGLDIYAGCAVSSTIAINVLATPPIINASANPTVVCPGDASSLTVTGANSYTWTEANSPPIYTASVVVNPMQSDSYTITGKTGGCLSTTTLSLQVHATPVITPIIFTPSICAGSQASLSINGTDSYTWYPGILTTPTINPSPSQTTNYTLVAFNGSCYATAISTVTVNPNPVLNIWPINQSICIGGSVALTATAAVSPAQSLNYLWSNGSAMPSITTSPTVNTNYTVTAIVPSTGCNDTEVISVTVYNPNFNITGPGTVCIGNSITLIANGSASSYSWSGGTSGNTLAVSPINTSTYSVTGSSGFCSATQSLVISVLPVPSLSISASRSVICADETAILIASGASTYLWSTNITSSTFTYIPSQSNYSTTSTFTVTGTGQNGCSKSAVITQSVSECTGGFDLDLTETDFSIYPNPNNGKFKIVTVGFLQFTIMNQMGQVVKNINNTESAAEIDVSEIPSGIYYISLLNGNVSTLKKMIVIH